MKVLGPRYASAVAVRRLSIVLALLLWALPPLSFAAPMALTASPADGSVSLSQPPCHAAADTSQEAAMADADCPHCAGDGPPSQCHCWGGTAPTGVAQATPDRAATPRAAGTPRVSIADTVPEAPAENLLRPPIPIHL
jgi:hypothetical protein